SHCSNSVSHAIRPGDHPGHGTDTHQPDVLIADELPNLGFVHWLGIAIDQQDFMSGRCERLEQKHPQVGHEVTGDPVVRVVKENSHDAPLKHSLATLSRSRRSHPGRPNISEQLLLRHRDIQVPYKNVSHEFILFLISRNLGIRNERGISKGDLDADRLSEGSRALREAVHSQLASPWGPS